MSNQTSDMFKSKVLGHPSGLFVLFFTEMWERFSYYGMRALLVLFLVSAMGIGGWDWSPENALALYGTYTAMVYLTPILGGFIADRYLGYRKAVVIGAVIMTLGHASMAIESMPIFLYIGIALLIVGNGFFKPNMTSIISLMYKDTPEKKDGAYTIFYMGVNAGAFLGIMLCGYLGETLGWSYGFGLAGIFMFLGMLQFHFAQKIFGDIGLKPEKTEDNTPKLEFEGDRLNPFTTFDRVLIFLSAGIGLTWIINDPLSKIGGVNLLKFGETDISNYFILSGVIIFLTLLATRIARFPTITKHRMIAIVLFAVFTVIFWASFEQAGGSMTLFAKDYTTRILTGSSATIFNIADIIITVVPIGIISWVLFKLFTQTFKKYALSNIFLGFSFVLIWVIVIWKINRNLNSNAYVVAYNQMEEVTIGDNGEEVKTLSYVTNATVVPEGAKLIPGEITIRESSKFKNASVISLIDVDKGGDLRYLAPDQLKKVGKDLQIKAEVVRKKGKEVEIPASWFGILNSLFIIIFAPLFSKWWESKYNPSGASKYGIGLILLGAGFAALAFGAMGIHEGAVVKVSMVWLVIAYLFHTLGELCLSPVALSYISKLVPGRMIALMFGVWYVAVAIGNKTAGKMGGMIEKIQEEHSLTFFFLIFTIVPVGLGLVAIALNPLFKKLMHGVR
ncbi:MAG: amino acid permease [Bacteroidetes bacterium RIFCSPHIGHO2_02_FULL_44_7]|nr:MAG: amino acid permease [Bacteroidetes bacterium RIFCSPHIGHO2_02_FULL_44_7]